MALLKVLLLLLGLGVSVNSEVSLQKRIIGGHDCTDDERRYHVRITGSSGTHVSRCGGSLIHSEWILTAAHCWKTGWTMTAELNVHPRTAGQQQQTVQNPVIYKDNTGQHDIMLLKLQKPVTDIQLPRLPDCKNRPKIGESVQLAGEAATTAGPNNERVTNAPIPPHLQCVDMKVDHCLNDHHTIYAHHHRFCVKETGKDACIRDSGGGVIFKGMIYGVIYSGGQKAFDRAVSNMDVCSYLQWIKQTTGLQ